jgi:hypothetical protein
MRDGVPDTTPDTPSDQRDFRTRNRRLLIDQTMLQAPIGVGMIDGAYGRLRTGLCFYLLFAATTPQVFPRRVCPGWYKRVCPGWYKLAYSQGD